MIGRVEGAVVVIEEPTAAWCAAAWQRVSPAPVPASLHLVAFARAVLDLPERTDR